MPELHQGTSSTTTSSPCAAWTTSPTCCRRRGTTVLSVRQLRFCFEAALQLLLHNLIVIEFLLPESGQPICGNGLVEPGEECDCGYSDQCRDQCCYDANQPDNKKCKLKPNKVCRWDASFSFRKHFQVSSGEGGGCSDASTLNPPRLSVPPAPAKVLAALPSALTRVATRSAERSRSALTRACATAWTPSAPPPSPRPTSPPATERRKSASTGWEAGAFAPPSTGCYSNQWLSVLTCPAPPPQGCSGSICEKYGLEACTCASQDGKDETELCHVCCMEKSESFHLFHLSLFHWTEVF